MRTERSGRTAWSRDFVSGRGLVIGAVHAFWRNRSGSISIEYGLIAVLISISIIGVSQLIALDLSSIFGDVQGGLANR